MTFSPFSANWRNELAHFVNGMKGTLDALGTIATQDASSVAITGGSIAGVTITGSTIAGYQLLATVGSLSGFRNKIINGGFDTWQRGASQTSNGYGSDDRWVNGNIGSTKTHDRQTFTLGQTDVPGNPTYYSRTVVTSAAGAGNYAIKVQRIEDVKTLAGKTATLTFYAKADAAKNIAIELIQFFGTGGSPSAVVTGIGAQKVALTTAWQKFSIAINIPSIAGKTVGSDDNDYLGPHFWFDAGSDWNARTDTLGQQSGTFDIARVSLVEGDATAEDDPFSPRHIGQERLLCQRYFTQFSKLVGIWTSSSTVRVKGEISPHMRATPSASLVTTTPTAEKWSFSSHVGSGSSIAVNNCSPSVVEVIVNGFSTSNVQGDPGYLVTTVRLDAEL